MQKTPYAQQQPAGLAGASDLASAGFNDCKLVVADSACSWLGKAACGDGDFSSIAPLF
ncbi:MAG: hypothetical protein ACQCN6_09710 [Candidatus Bathyarchaeia archaeon]